MRSEYQVFQEIHRLNLQYITDNTYLKIQRAGKQKELVCRRE